MPKPTNIKPKEFTITLTVIDSNIPPNMAEIKKPAKKYAMPQNGKA